MQIYLIYKMAFSHPTSNNMVYVSTFLSPRRLFCSPIGSRLYWPQPRKATKLTLFQPHGVYKEPEMGQNHHSHLCCCLDNTSPRLAFTSTSAAASGCSIPRPEEPLAVSPCSCPPRGPQLLHSQVNSLSRTYLQMHRWLSLASQLTLKNVLGNAPLTFTLKSTHSQ